MNSILSFNKPKTPEKNFIKNFNGYYTNNLKSESTKTTTFSKENNNRNIKDIKNFKINQNQKNKKNKNINLKKTNIVFTEQIKLTFPFKNSNKNENKINQQSNQQKIKVTNILQNKNSNSKKNK